MKKILIIDDDMETLELLNRVLKKYFDIATVSDPEQLATVLTGYTPDLIIVDHLMGCKTSKEIIDGFKQQAALKNTPIILHSGHDQIEEIARSANVSGFLKKPSGINEIRSCIEAQLRCSNIEPVAAAGIL